MLQGWAVLLATVLLLELIDSRRFFLDLVLVEGCADVPSFDDGVGRLPEIRFVAGLTVAVGRIDTTSISSLTVLLPDRDRRRLDAGVQVVRPFGTLAPAQNETAT
jgi:hypothetical protein